MNVLFLTRLYWPHVGGVEKHVAEVSKRLKERGHEVVIVTERYDAKLPSFEKVDGIDVYRLPAASKWSVWQWWWQHLDLIMASKVIHIHDVFWWFLPFRFLFPFHKVYMTFHGYEGPGLPKWNQVFWHRLAARLTRGNICIGDFHRKWYKVKPTFVSYGAAA